MPKLRKNLRWLNAALAPSALALCGCVPVYLVKDLETRTQGSYPTSFTEAGDGMYVVATHHAVGRELLYLPDIDVPAGDIVGDLNPGSAGSSPGNVFTRGTRAFFYADDNSDGNSSAAQYALFVTDGPEDTTVRLTAPGSALPSQEFEPFGNYGADGVLFLRREAATGIEIWRSDGTVDGTQIVQDLNPGTAHSSPQGMTLFGGHYYFSAAGSDGQRELYRTNGTGVELVKDLNASGQSQPRDLVVFNGNLYFGADHTATFRRGLFKSDGTSDGTVLVTDQSSDTFRPEPVAATSTKLFLMAYYQELWVSDGTAGGTTFLYDFEPNGEGEIAQSFVTLGSRVLFHVPTDSGRELWASDGTAGGTVQIAPSVDTGTTATILGSHYYYVVGDSLYRTNGTVPGTSLVYTQAGLSPQSLASVNGRLYFWGNDTDVGGEAWQSDGTPGGTALVGDYNIATLGSNPQSFVKAGAYTFFTADVAGTGRELYRTDGTAGGTALVKDIRPGATGSSPAGLVAYGGVLYFRADDGTNGAELWRSDGTAGGTVMVEDINPGTSTTSSTPRFFATVGSKVCFAATRAAEGREPWCSDGTAAGTDLLLDIRPGASSSSAFDETPVATGGFVYFGANDGTNGDELWRSDGTPTGTTRVSNINTAANGSSVPTRFAVMNGAVYFTATANGTRWDMYRSDGGAPTLITGGITMTGSGPNPGPIAAAGSTLFFGATSTASGYELWKTDGTAGGVQLVKDIRSGATGSSLNYMTAVGDKVFFSAGDGVNGTELWRSDGTTTEIVTGEGDARSSSPLQLAACGNRLYFSQDDLEYGTEAFYTEP